MNKVQFLVKLLIVCIIFCGLQIYPVNETYATEEEQKHPFNEHPSWSPDSTKIVFCSDKTGKRYIYVINVDGTGLTQLAMGENPAWSPDGAKIAYGYKGEIWVMNPDGTGQTQLTSDPRGAFDPCWSPNGNKIAFSSHRGGIIIMTAQGVEEGYLAANAGDPAWAPDGSYIAFIKPDLSAGDLADNIWRRNVDKSNYFQLTFGNFLDDSPSFSPDGTKIVFASNRPGPERISKIWLMNPDGSGLTQLTTDEVSCFDPAWSPDGTKIAFRRATENDCNIWIMNPDGTGLTKVTNINSFAKAPTPPKPVPPAPRLALSIQLEKSEYSLGEPVNLTINLVNEGNAPAKLPGHFAPDIFPQYLEVFITDEAGKKVHYIGICGLGLPHPSPEELFYFQPNDRKSFVWPLAGLYKLDQPGKYSVKATYSKRLKTIQREQFVLEEDPELWTGEVESNTLDFAIGQGFGTNLSVNHKIVCAQITPIVKENEILVPLRNIAEQLGLKVVWEPYTKTVILSSPKRKIELGVNKEYALVNGNRIAIDTPATIVKGYTMVPLKFLAQVLNVKTNWDPKYRIVYVYLL